MTNASNIEIDLDSLIFYLTYQDWRKKEIELYMYNFEVCLIQSVSTTKYI